MASRALINGWPLAPGIAGAAEAAPPIVVPVTISGTPAAAVVGDNPTFTPVISGGTAPYTLSLASGTLPPGRTVNGAAKTVTGAYTTAGNFAYVLRATDALGATADLSVSVVVSAASANALMPINTPLIVVGPSIQNVTNTRAPRHWLSQFSDGFFYTGPGTNQSVGGAGMIAQGASVALNYWGARENFTDAQIPTVASGKSACIFFDDIINSIAAPLADLKAEVDRRIAKYLGAGSTFTNVWIAFATCMKIGTTATNSANDATRIALNDYIISKKGSHPRLIVCDTRLQITDAVGKSYDGLHPTGNLALEQGKADAADFVPFRAAGKITYGATAPAANLEADWRFEGTGGTPYVGATGDVATGFAVNLSTSGTATSGTSAGSTVGMTAVCSKGVDADGNPAQIIDVVGTPTADWYLTVTNPVAAVNQAGAYMQAWVKDAVTGSGQANPAGIAGRGFAIGTLGQTMNKLAETNAGILNQPWSGVARTVPFVGLVNNQGSSQLTDYSLSGKSGVAVNLRLTLSQMGVERCETEAYNAPFSLSSPFPGTSQNPIHTTRPAIAGTKSVGSVGTMQVAAVAGGNITWTAFDIVDSANAVLTTRAPAGAAMTYTWLAADQGKTVRLRETGSNSLGSIIVDDGLTYAIS